MYEVKGKIRTRRRRVGKPSMVWREKGPCGWDQLLARHGLVGQELSLSSPANLPKDLIKWVHANYAHRYVPEPILEALGLEPTRRKYPSERRRKAHE